MPTIKIYAIGDPCSAKTTTLEFIKTLLKENDAVEKVELICGSPKPHGDDRFDDHHLEVSLHTL